MADVKHTLGALFVGYGGKYVSIYSKPISEAKESDRVCRFPRTAETEQRARVMALGQELFESLQVLTCGYSEVGNLYHDVSRKDISAAWEKARALVAKATGEGV